MRIARRCWPAITHPMGGQQGSRQGRLAIAPGGLVYSSVSEWLLPGSAGAPGGMGKKGVAQAGRVASPPRQPGDWRQAAWGHAPKDEREDTRMDLAQRAEQFLQTQGRDIEQARADYHLGRLDQAGLLAVLGRYQNEDGGFFGLEVDIVAPESNPFATELALYLCLQAGVSGEEPLLQKTVAYLENTQSEDGDWHLSEAVYRAALAPWFEGWTWPTLNPACTTAGLLRALGLGSDRLHRRVEGLFQQMANVADLTGDEFYAVRPYAFYFLPEWEHPQRPFYLSGLVWWLIRQHVEGKLADSGHFFEYVRDRQTAVARQLPPVVLEARLDALAAEQQDDGGWPSPYHDSWRGWITAQSLVTLRLFGRI